MIFIKTLQTASKGSGLTAQLIEKAYYVTEALQIIAAQWPQQVVFKGGTSLSKGWKLINRFSEDLDLFLNQNAFEPRLGANRTDKMLTSIEEIVGSYPTPYATCQKQKKAAAVLREAYPAPVILSIPCSSQGMERFS